MITTSVNTHPKIEIGIQAGFTLLEMILVLFLIGLMASATLMLTENVEDQAKFDATKQRIEMMRKAIVGDLSRTLNGGPEISGFVADMGRLPACVRELLESQYCIDASGALPVWTVDASTALGYGWRGPYIHVLPEQNGALRFRDGYGNANASDPQNSGWKEYSVSGAEISVTSDGFSIADTSDDYSVAPLVVASDWQVNNVNVNFINLNVSNALPTDTSGADVNLRIYLSGPSHYVMGDDSINTALTIPLAEIPANNHKTYLFNFDSSNVLPIGTHRYAVVCTDGKVFNGNCSSAVDLSLPDDLRTFTVVPRQTITLDWIIQ